MPIHCSRDDISVIQSCLLCKSSEDNPEQKVVSVSLLRYADIQSAASKQIHENLVDHKYQVSSHWETMVFKLMLEQVYNHHLMHLVLYLTQDQSPVN